MNDAISFLTNIMDLAKKGIIVVESIDQGYLNNLLKEKLVNREAAAFLFYTAQKLENIFLLKEKDLKSRLTKFQIFI